jgi:hypothetical protein|nr:MAG: hypothetical protein [Bacteriophage sp.]
MINKDNLIEEILKFINSKIADISSNNPLFDIVAKPYLSKIVDTNVSKLDKALSLITDEKGMVDGDGLLNDMIDRLIVSKANTINGVTIGEGSIKVTIPFMNKTVIFDKDDFNELKTNIEKYGKSE